MTELSVRECIQGYVEGLDDYTSEIDDVEPHRVQPDENMALFALQNPSQKLAYLSQQMEGHGYEVVEMEKGWLQTEKGDTELVFKEERLGGETANVVNLVVPGLSLEELAELYTDHPVEAEKEYNVSAPSSTSARWTPNTVESTVRMNAREAAQEQVEIEAAGYEARVEYEDEDEIIAALQIDSDTTFFYIPDWNDAVEELLDDLEELGMEI